MGTHLRALSKSYLMNTNMTGLRLVFENMCILVLRTKVASIGRVKRKQQNSHIPINIYTN